MVRIEMLHDDKSHSRFGWQMAQQLHRCFKPARRTADSDNRATFRWFFVLQAVVGVDSRTELRRSLTRPRTRVFLFPLAAIEGE